MMDPAHQCIMCSVSTECTVQKYAGIRSCFQYKEQARSTQFSDGALLPHGFGHATTTTKDLHEVKALDILL